MPNRLSVPQLVDKYHFRLQQEGESDEHYRDALVGHLHQHDPILAAEVARGKPWDAWQEPERDRVVDDWMPSV